MRFVWLLCGLVGSTWSAFGGDKTIAQQPLQELQTQAPIWSFDLKSDYTLGSKIKRNGSLGSQAVVHEEVEALRNFHLFNKYYLQFGVDCERFDFSRSNSVFPYAMTSVSAEVDISYWSGDEFHPLLQLQPGLYFTRDHITANSFDIPIRAVSGIKIRENIYLVLGADVDPWERIPVLPVGGIDWEVNDQVNLRAVFPSPRFSYHPNKALEFFIAGDFAGGAYRNGPTHDHRTNNAILDYVEYRAGAGVSYDLQKGVSLELTAGWTFARRFDYVRADTHFTSRGAPYFKLDLSIDLF